MEHMRRPRRPVDLNVMKRNMTIAKGFLDISLLSANANQLRNVLNFGDTDSSTFYVVAIGIVVSLILQRAGIRGAGCVEDWYQRCWSCKGLVSEVLVVQRAGIRGADRAKGWYQRCWSYRGQVAKVLVVQEVLAGIILIVGERFDLNDKDHDDWSDRLNTIVMCIIFVVLLVNVFISSFGVDVANPGMHKTPPAIMSTSRIVSLTSP
ncbi:putative Ninjurin domain-containing protein [Homarus americanus]|uniref:Putative Ninjurin domain-containing protein n=1 Tax=Homarus americanus TaxID=6706 RepID=A0A8J5T276_HOMAM|nr:putative Ninjurin domain-containing protein [Homarus americanus]